MATRAELKARLTLDHAAFTRGIALAQAGASRLSSGLVSAAQIGARAMLYAGTAAIGLGTAIAIGTTKAFALGSALKELASRTGVLPGKLLVLQQAFKDAGMQADDVGPAINRMQKFIAAAAEKGDVKFGIDFEDLANLRPEEQFEAIGKAINGITNQSEKVKAVMDIFGKQGGRLLDLFGDPQAMSDAAAAVGKQAGILNQSADLFDKISDKLGHAGTKLQGFFVGVASGVADSLLPILDRMDKADFSAVGKRFGDSLVAGAQALVGLFNNPQLLLGTLNNAFQTVILGIGNVLIAVFRTGIEFFKTGMSAAIVGIGSQITAGLIEAFQRPIANLQAEIEHAMESFQRLKEGKHPANLKALEFDIKLNEKARDLIGRNMSGELNPLGRGFQEQVDRQKAARDKLIKSMPPIKSIAERTEDILKQKGGVKFGLTNAEGELGEGMNAEEWRAQSRKQFKSALDKAAEAAKNFTVPDVMGAGPALAAAKAKTQAAIPRGAAVIEDRIAREDFIFGGRSFKKGAEIPQGIVQPPAPPKQEFEKATTDFIEGGKFYPKGSKVPVAQPPPMPQMGAAKAPGKAPGHWDQIGQWIKPQQEKVQPTGWGLLEGFATAGLRKDGPGAANIRQTQGGLGVGAGAAYNQRSIFGPPPEQQKPEKPDMSGVESGIEDLGGKMDDFINTMDRHWN